jgi:hypothetical protein
LPDPERGRHPEPGATEGHPDRHVGRAHAGRERAERARGAGVRVGADDDVTRLGVGLEHPLMADSLVYLGKGGTGVRREFAQQHVVVGQLPSGAGLGVVDEQDRPFGVRHFFQVYLRAASPPGGPCVEERHVHLAMISSPATTSLPDFAPGFLGESPGQSPAELTAELNYALATA